jgi:putative ABC transport system ATP-binding protein
MSKPKLRFSKVSKKKIIKSSNGERQIVVLEDIDFEVAPKEIFTVVGPSGSGKSTLLRLINRLEELSFGTILLDEEDIKELDVIDLRRRVGIVFQEPILFEGTVEENILFGLKNKNEDPPPQKAEELLKLVGLDKELCKRDSCQLSVGQKQRISIARSLCLNPEVLLLDEPTSALDPSSTLKVEKLVLNLQSEFGLTVIFITHQLDQALRIGHRGMLLIDGRKIDEGEVSAFLKNPKVEITQKFIRGQL